MALASELQAAGNCKEKQRIGVAVTVPALKLQELRTLRVLGRGATGTVFLVQIEKKGGGGKNAVAVKLVAKNESFRGGKSRRERMEKEIEILSALPDHPLLPRLVGLLETPAIVGFAVEFCPGGDLHRLRQKQPDGMFSDSAIRFYAAEVTLALQVLHSHGIVYRDLKPENILVRQNGHIMLADFDLSVWRNEQRRRDSVAGTEEYMAPEMISGRDYGKEVDLWCLGILLYEMSYGKTPFRGSDKNETFRRILRVDPPLPATSTRPLNDLISKLLRKDPQRRATLNDVKSHRFFARLRWESVTSLLRPPFLPEDEEEEAAERKDMDLEKVMSVHASPGDSASEADDDEDDLFSE